MKKVLVIVVLQLTASCVTALAPSFEDARETQRLVDEGVYFMREGNLERAAADFELASDLTVSAAAIDGLGCVAFMQGEYEKAESLFWEAYDTDSTYNNSLGNLALLYEKLGNKAKAKELFEQAVLADPKNYRMRNNYAAYLDANSGSKSRTIKELYKAEALFNHPMIYDNINIAKEN
jgi:Tfp pilus assembly protein PilF